MRSYDTRDLIETNMIRKAPIHRVSLKKTIELKMVREHEVYRGMDLMRDFGISESYASKLLKDMLKGGLISRVSYDRTYLYGIWEDLRDFEYQMDRY